MTPVSETIGRRYSCRSYSDDPVSESVRKAFQQLVDAPQTGLFGNKPRFSLIAMDVLPPREWKTLGTYGIIKNAHLFLAGLVRPAPMATQDYGYCKEKLILQATGLGLQTCWIGGTFAISAFGRAAGMHRSELLPTVTPLGYAARRQSLTERFMRGVAGSDQRLPWTNLFFNGDAETPLSTQEAGDFSEALENVRRAPSASNKQPWRIVYEEKRKAFLFYLSRTTGYKYLRNVSLQEIDLGIAMCHFDLTVQELGIAGTWRREDPVPKIRSWEYVASWIASEK